MSFFNGFNIDFDAHAAANAAAHAAWPFTQHHKPGPPAPLHPALAHPTAHVMPHGLPHPALLSHLPHPHLPPHHPANAHAAAHHGQARLHPEMYRHLAAHPAAHPAAHHAAHHPHHLPHPHLPPHHPANRPGGGGGHPAALPGMAPTPVHPALAHALASNPAVHPRGVEVDTRVGNNVRRFPMGFTSVTAVNAGTSASVTAQPQVPYRPEKFVVPSDIAGSFDITNILVGKDSQFVVPNPIPARAFTETAVDNLLSFHGVAISQIITIQVTNTGGANLIFKGYMAGTAVE